MAQRIAFRNTSRIVLRSCPSSLKLSYLSSTTKFPATYVNNYNKSLRKHFASPATDATKEEGEKKLEEWENPNAEPWDRRVYIDEFEEGEEIPYVNLPPLDDGSGKVLASPELHALAERITELKLKDVVQLTKLIQEHFGFDDSVSAGFEVEEGSSGEKEEEAVEEKTLFELKLSGFDAKSKIKVIKEVRAITGLGLKEAKELVEGAPKLLMKDIKKEEAEELKAKLEAVGGTAEVV